MHDEPLLTRTVRQALRITPDVHVTVPPDDIRYAEAVARALGPSQTVEVHVRGEGFSSEYHATRDLWAPEGRTILLLGDSYFTDRAIETIGGFGLAKYQGFGRKGRSYITGCKYGELWAASWWPEQFAEMDAHLEVIRQHHEDGTITRPTGWMLLRAFQGTHLGRHKCDPEWMTTIDDLTDDFDFPADYINHPVTKKVIKTMEAGKGHAARNKNLPHLLERLGVQPKHVLHVGAHDGEEMPYYTEARFKKITLVEADPDLAAKLEEKFGAQDGVEILAVAAGPDTQESVTLFRMPVSNMNTLVGSGNDAPVGKIQVPMVKLADIAPDANVAVIDVQGLELGVLQGADLSRYEIVMVETSTVEDPTMASTFAEVTQYMQEHGFRIEEYWVRDYQWVARWGRKRHHREAGEVRDVVYVRETPAETPAEETAAAEPGVFEEAVAPGGLPGNPEAAGYNEPEPERSGPSTVSPGTVAGDTKTPNATPKKRASRKKKAVETVADPFAVPEAPAEFPWGEAATSGE